MRKITVLTAVLLLGALLLSCGGPKLIGLIPAYNGLPVYDTDHEFAKEDFYVIASFEDGSDRVLQPDEFELEKLYLKEGYYTLEITYKGEKQKCYVECDVGVYPSDFAQEGSAE